MKNTLMTLFVMLSFLTLPAFANERCIKDDWTVDIYRHHPLAIDRIDVFKAHELLIRDLGLFNGSGLHKQPCHVRGSTYQGEFVTYGGCETFEDPSPKVLWIHSSNQELNLKTFACSEF